MQRKLRLLAQRACAPGVLVPGQLGVTLHALHQLEALRLQDAAVINLVRDHVGGADARTQANALHVLALEARATFDVKVALPEGVEAALRETQEELSERVDQLTGPEVILVMEAVMKLLPFGTAVVDGLLLRELQDRSLALIAVVERPVELIGIVRVVVEGLQSPSLGVNEMTPPEEDLSDALLSSSLSPSRHANSGGRLSHALPSAGEGSSGAAAGALWSEAVLSPLLVALEARVEGWRTQDLMSLVDAMTLRGRGGDRTGTRNEREHLSPRASLVVEHTSSTAVVPDACRAFIGNVLLQRIAPAVPRLSPSQSAAWLLRLQRLGYHRESHSGPFKQLFLQFANRLAEASSHEAMSASQLSTCACSLATVLVEEGASAPGRAGTAPLTCLTATETDTCLRAFLLLLSALCRTLEASFGRQSPQCRSEAAAVAAVSHVLPVLIALPETALVSCGAEGLAAAAGGDAQHRRDDGFHALRHTFPWCLRWCCGFMLRHFDSLLPREKVHVAATAFHWNAFGDSAVVDGTAVRLGGTSVTASTLLGALAAGSPTAASVTMTSSTSPSPMQTLAQQFVGLCGLVQQSMNHLNTLDCLQIFNEAVASAYTARTGTLNYAMFTATPRSTSTRERASPAVQADMSREEALSVLLRSLHEAIQSSFSSGPGRAARRSRSPTAVPSPSSPQGTSPSIPTAALVRYLTSLSKLGVRVKAPYYDLLDTLQSRTLTSFESIAVLGVMSRHNLHRPSILKSVIRRLPELTGSATSLDDGRRDGTDRGDVLQLSQRALLLKYLGQAGAQRFVRAPSSPYFEPGAFFTSTDEVRQLSVVELIFVVNGLTALRQYASPSLAWALQALNDRACTAGKRAASHDDYAEALAGVRSATMQAELLSALLHLGAPLASLALVGATADSLRQALMQSRSLFVDLARLADAWPMLPVFLKSATEVADEGGQRGVARAVEALTQLQRTAAMLTRARLLDIANPTTLRPNTFLIRQLAAGVQTSGYYLPPLDNHEARQSVAAAVAPTDTFRLAATVPSTGTATPRDYSALPEDISDTLDVLVRHVDLAHLNAVLTSPPQVVECAVVGLWWLTTTDYASPPRLLFKSEAVTLLRLVQKHMESLRVKDALLVWSLVDELLGCASAPLPSTEGGAVNRPPAGATPLPRRTRVRQAWSTPANQDVVPLLRDLREVCRSNVMEEKAMEKLSPVERRLLDTQLS